MEDLKTKIKIKQIKENTEMKLHKIKAINTCESPKITYKFGVIEWA